MRTNGVYIPYSMNATRGFLFGGSEPAPNFSRRTSSAYPIQQAMNQNGEQYNNGPGFVNDPDMNHTVGFHNGAGLYNESGFVNDQNINAGGIMQPYHADQNQPPQNEFSGSWQQDQSISRPFGFHAESHPPFVDLTRGIYPSTLPVIRIEGVSQTFILHLLLSHQVPTQLRAHPKVSRLTVPLIGSIQQQRERDQGVGRPQPVSLWQPGTTRYHFDHPHHDGSLHWQVLGCLDRAPNPCCRTTNHVSCKQPATEQPALSNQQPSCPHRREQPG